LQEEDQVKSIAPAFLLLMSFSVADAKDFDSDCVSAILKNAATGVRTNNIYLPNNKSLITYKFYENEKTQEVYTETGRAFTDVSENTLYALELRTTQKEL